MTKPQSPGPLANTLLIRPLIFNLRKNQNRFWRNQSTTSQIQSICLIIVGIHAKILEETFCRFFSKAWGKMEQILLAWFSHRNCYCYSYLPNLAWLWHKARRIGHPLRNCYCYNDALQGRKGHGLFTWCWHWFLWHYHWSFWLESCRRKRYIVTEVLQCWIIKDLNFSS